MAGSGPALSSAAVSRACSGVERPGISAPSVPSKPSGACCQLTNGTETSQVGGDLRIARAALEEAQERAGVPVVETTEILQLAGGQEGIVGLVHAITSIARAEVFVTVAALTRVR